MKLTLEVDQWIKYLQAWGNELTGAVGEPMHKYMQEIRQNNKRDQRECSLLWCSDNRTGSGLAWIQDLPRVLSQVVDLSR